MEEKKAFHITITDNETGEKVQDYDTNVIIGATDFNDENANCFSLIKHSNSMVVSSVLAAFEDAKAHIFEAHPELNFLVQLVQSLDEKEEQPEENEVEP